METLSQKINESFEVNEASAFDKKYNEKVKKFKDVKIGDTGYINPYAGGDWNDELGSITWKGTGDEAMKKGLINLREWEMTKAEFKEDFGSEDFVVVDDKDWGSTTMQYDGDPSSAVVYK